MSAPDGPSRDASPPGAGRSPYRTGRVAARTLGFEVVVVDAIHEDAACFYLKYGFRRFFDHELRLFMTAADLRATFGAAPD